MPVGNLSMPIYFKAPSRLDAGHVPSLRSDFERLATATDDVVVDMARTEVIDGSGVGAMVFAFKRLAANGRRLTIRNVSGQPLDLLHSAGLLRTLTAEKRDSRLMAAVRSLRLERLLAPALRPAVAAPSIDAMASKRDTRADVGERTKGAA